MAQQILVVCIGNICRSPMAELLLQRMLPRHRVRSAGLAALTGQPMDASARAVAAAHGCDGSRHVARQVHGGLIAGSDCIMAMETAQVDALAALAPEAAGRIFLLDRWHAGEDIDDPFRHPRAQFERAWAHIEAAVQAWVPHLYRC